MLPHRTPYRGIPPSRLNIMSNGKGQPSESIKWLAKNWPYVLLVLIAAVTAFLVVLAFNRPLLIAPSAPRPATTPATPSPLPSPPNSPTPTSTPSPTLDTIPEPSVVAFLGDSYVAELEGVASEPPWTTLLAQANHWVEVNFGAPETGFATASEAGSPYVDRVAEVVASDPAIVFVVGGRFDFAGSSSPSAVSVAIRQTFDSLREGLPNAKIIALAPIWEDDKPPARLVIIGSEVMAAVHSIGGSYIDVGYTMAGPGALTGSDGITPNGAGHARLHSAVADAITPLIADSEGG